MKVSAIDKTLKDIISGGYYKIPRFQREFQWEQQNIQDFWEDVFVKSENEHFIGALVTYKISDDLYGLVDGQQRMTTITIILSVLRHFFSEEGNSKLADGVHNLIERKDINSDEQYIVQSESSYPYFQEYIQKNSSPSVEPEIGKEEELISEAYKFFKSKIGDELNLIKSNQFPHEKKIIEERLVELRDKLLQIKLIYVELDNEADAHLIFETLNTRGKDLTVSDLVKNHLLEMLPKTNAGVDIPKDRWIKVVEEISNSNAELSMDEFIHRTWLSNYEYTSAKKLFPLFKQKVNKINAEEILIQMQSDASIYRRIFETSYYQWNKQEKVILNSLNALNTFKVKQDIPMVISILRDYDNKLLNLRQTKKYLIAIEKFHFQFNAVTSSRSSGGISSMYAKHARELSGETKMANKMKILHGLYDKLSERIPSYAEFEANFVEILHTNSITKYRNLVRYILEKVDLHLRGESSAPIDYSNMTIEHIYPINPKLSIPKLSEEIVGQIGNLVLISEKLNEKLANKPFKGKQNIFKTKDDFPYEDIKTISKWGKKEIDKRTKVISKMAYNDIWKI